MSTPSPQETAESQASAALGRDDTAAGLGRDDTAAGLGREDVAGLGREDVAQLARLARLALTDEELDHFAGQLSAVLDAVAEVGKADVGDVPPMTHAVPLTNVTREDVVIPSLPRDVVLAQAPAAEDDRFRVPQILGEEE
ncbi:aspartyl/glutamyl-tRNA(Asn/Gln) amidotransferase subunit C [Geodermatophilus africanus]|jgi:aspartyl-tRNA(Asn)/glutamyl-tRNA(Gln) amidotransferase subunit C|uniref:Aspartyl/glutamyl-tRNA(Asn/Gln) amidotransferase subunit C n=1 Tax=Geodermatophilus africanus TaxID=1137993 RepID=A0A1H3EW32_9ACTN|nr:Asp-tRNA(Asn)/Glu-tRNA(Gln) amidotransferase subunit GatC [Geodermatophilus africanus]SDX82139.1 aspartyl/glutamyl-tRNA(Asn/Gln) amidotransferase subunit C [Geodermatophilus africanus]